MPSIGERGSRQVGLSCAGYSYSSRDIENCQGGAVEATKPRRMRFCVEPFPLAKPYRRGKLRSRRRPAAASESLPNCFSDSFQSRLRAIRKMARRNPTMRPERSPFRGPSVQCAPGRRSSHASSYLARFRFSSGIVDWERRAGQLAAPVAPPGSVAAWRA